MPLLLQGIVLAYRITPVTFKLLNVWTIKKPGFQTGILAFLCKINKLKRYGIQIKQIFFIRFKWCYNQNRKLRKIQQQILKESEAIDYAKAGVQLSKMQGLRIVCICLSQENFRIKCGF
ncbi:hypothetical protein KL86SPO_70615 [uncultured Sporomusa sp.]|uniref:Uncharacterized protein n=1 Tax=uncultured Sporomusa sp. TaxID=307249 RepID=A0A212M1X8_9FIRM|nr:hypothetical protein KL86SPO_70615 [uncultured Sporomusa sp.]